MAADLRPVLDAIYVLEDLLNRAKPVPMRSEVRIDQAAYLASTAKLRESARPLTEFERGRAQTPVSDALDEIERLGTQSPKSRFSSRHRLKKEDVRAEIGKLQRGLLDDERARIDESTQRVEIADAPTLDALVDGVANEGRRYLLCRQGTQIAQLRPPPRG